MTKVSGFFQLSSKLTSAKNRYVQKADYHAKGKGFKKAMDIILLIEGYTESECIMELQEEVKSQLREGASTMEAATALSPGIAYAALLVTRCFKQQGKVILFGNGGSAADAQHIAAEFVGVLRRSNMRAPLDAVALTTNTSVLTAIVNDTGGDAIFVRQLDACARPSDVAIGISTSGNSDNIYQALVRAKELGLYTIGFLGCTGGRINDVVDVSIIVPAFDTPRIQEVHITIGHILCDLVEKMLKEEGLPDAGFGC